MSIPLPLFVIDTYGQSHRLSLHKEANTAIYSCTFKDQANETISIKIKLRSANNTSQVEEVELIGKLQTTIQEIKGAINSLFALE